MNIKDNKNDSVIYIYIYKTCKNCPIKHFLVVKGIFLETNININMNLGMKSCLYAVIRMQIKSVDTQS